MRSKLLTATMLCLAATTPALADCLDCHSSKEGSAIHALLESAHGASEISCVSCHGASMNHMAQPTRVEPDISFGPRWSASPALQDASCLDCHQDNIARHWNEALHMANNVTCVSCHDLHTVEDPIQSSGGQGQVCTTCHKTQKTGIHGREQMLRMNPPCTECHNPHADQRPQGVFLANDSKGCRRCHNMKSMASSDKVGNKAKNYHRVMEKSDRICIDCHIGVAHGDPDASELFLPLPRSERDVTLFYPGKSDADWLLTEHRGSQPLRQGTNCRQCHRGEEAALGMAMGGPEPTSRSVTVHFSSEQDSLVTTLSWQGAADDTAISLMWGFGDNDALRRGGCWAACHGDMPGMSLDSGSGVDKYLWSSLAQRRQMGQPPITRPEEELQRELAAGNFAELWTVDLQRGGVSVSALLAGASPLADSGVTATASFDGGTWTVAIIRPVSPAAPMVSLAPGREYTFGMALHGGGRKGREHWVSLPMTLSMDNDDTDFITN